jgi:hypothetical protein
MRTSCLLLLGAFTLPACASRAYVYEPVTTTSAEVGGRPAARYRIPLVRPEGDAQLVSFGVAEVKPADSDEPPTRVLAMRLIVANRSEQSWTVDARVQALVFDDGQEATPMYALALGGSPPMVDVPAGESRAIDLLFPLPRGVEEARDLPRFDAVWSVRTSQHVVTGRTPFARNAVMPAAYADVAAPFWLDRLNPALSSITLVRLQGPYLHRAR